MVALYLFLAVLASTIAGITVYFIFRAMIRGRIAESLGTSLFLIKIPRPGNDSSNSARSGESKDFKSELAHFEQLLASLAAIKKPLTFEVAVPHVGEEIHFYLAVPK